jgi:chromosome segregation ATPase
MAGRTDKQESIESLRQRYARLNERKITAAADLKNAEEQLDRLKQEAREQFGTDDAAELQKQLEELNRENERKRAEYQQHLDKIEADLNEAEKSFGEA